MKRQIVFIVPLFALILIFGYVIWNTFLEENVVEDNSPLKAQKIPFTYYGWFSVDYTEVTPALERMRAYTNLGFVYQAKQASILKKIGFPHIVYVFNSEDVVNDLVIKEKKDIHELMIESEGKSYKSEVLNFAASIPDFRSKFFARYRTRLVELREELRANETLDAVDMFLLADEPALHRNIYLDQDFLEKMVTTFNQVFPKKKSLMTFAQNPSSLDTPFPGTGPHMDPPSNLDIIVVDPYFLSDQVSCDKESVRKWIYDLNPNSNISWAKQYNKPIIFTGDAQLRDGEPVEMCYLKYTYEILKNDPSIVGLLWFSYDKSYKEKMLSGAANNPKFVQMIERMSAE